MKIILLGACGRMGKIVAETAKQSGDEIVCGIDICPTPAEFPIYPSFSDVKESADAVIDFSSANNLEERLAYCKKHKLPIILAATGYSETDLALIEKYAESVAIFKTGNLSLGVNLLQFLAKKAAEILGDGFDAEIIERHHNMKKDAPSGTALMLAESVREGFGSDKSFTFGRHGMVGAREKKEIGIHAVRGGTIVGEHEIGFYGEDEIVTVAHSARSRKVFAAGALRAANWLVGKGAGLYNMDDMLKDLI